MKIIIAILVVLLGLGGGAYYAQDSGLYDFKQLKQYIPSQVQALLNIENKETISVSSNELEEVKTQPFDIPDQQVSTQGFGLQDSFFENQSAQNNKQIEGSGSNIKNTASNIANPNDVGTSNDLVERSDIMQNPQPQLAVNVSSSRQKPVENNHAQKSKETAIEVLDASPEEVKMVKELNKIESKIVKLDNENEDLQEKYSQMLKANRGLALKIREIDSKIKTIDGRN